MLGSSYSACFCRNMTRGAVKIPASTAQSLCVSSGCPAAQRWVCLAITAMVRAILQACEAGCLDIAELQRCMMLCCTWLCSTLGSCLQAPTGKQRLDTTGRSPLPADSGHMQFLSMHCGTTAHVQHIPAGSASRIYSPPSKVSWISHVLCLCTQPVPLSPCGCGMSSGPSHMAMHIWPQLSPLSATPPFGRRRSSHCGAGDSVNCASDASTCSPKTPGPHSHICYWSAR